jgi:pimeloyl-ACP methyl ester carboxylesterase
VEAYDPQPALAEIEIPMLWVYGANDTQSDVSASLSILSHLRDRQNKRYDIAVLEGGDHGIGIPVPTPNGASQYFTAAPGFLETIEGWLKTRASP